MYSRKSITANDVDLDVLYPNCQLLRKLCLSTKLYAWLWITLSKLMINSGKTDNGL